MSTIDLFGTVIAHVVFPVQFVSFWISIALSVVYLPLLLTGFERGMGILSAVLAVHIVSLVLGHGYGREDSMGDLPQ